MKYWSIFLLTVLISLTQCTLAWLKPVTIVSYSPFAKKVNDIENTVISITFSQKMKEANTTYAFSLKEGETRVYGRPSWPNKKTLIFTPYRKLKEYTPYTFSVETGAEDIYGNSLQKAFTHRFSSSTDRSKVTIARTLPAHQARISNVFEPFIVEFSEPVNKSSALKGFSIEPSVEGVKSFDNDATLRFTPTEPYKYNQIYIVTLSAKISDLNGNTLLSERKFHFSLNFDATPLRLVSVKNYIPAPATAAASSTLTLAPAPTGALGPVNTGWETRWGLTFTFNKKIDLSSFSNALSFAPKVSYAMQNKNTQYQSEITLTFDSALRYDTRYSITLNNSLKDEFGLSLPSAVEYIVQSDGQESTPPRITRLVFSESAVTRTSTSATLVELNYRDAINVGAFTTKAYSFFDVYIDLAPGATIYSSDVLQHFSIASSSGGISIGIVNVDIISSTSSPADYNTDVPPSPTPTATQRVARVLVEVTNHANSAVITLTMNADFRDSLQNPMSSKWVWKIQK